MLPCSTCVLLEMFLPSTENCGIFLHLNDPIPSTQQYNPFEQTLLSTLSLEGKNRFTLNMASTPVYGTLAHLENSSSGYDICIVGFACL